MKLRSLAVLWFCYLLVGCSSQKPEVWIEVVIEEACNEATFLQTVDVLTNRLTHLGVKAPVVGADLAANKIEFTLPCGNNMGLYEEVLTTPYRFSVMPLVKPQVATPFLALVRDEIVEDEEDRNIILVESRELPAGLLIHRDVQQEVLVALSEEKIKKQNPGLFLPQTGKPYDSFYFEPFQPYVLVDPKAENNIYNAMIASAKVKKDRQYYNYENGKWYDSYLIEIKLKPEYTICLEKLTGMNIGLPLPCILDGRVLCYPFCMDAIEGGHLQLAFDDNNKERDHLRSIAAGIEAGELTVPVRITGRELLSDKLTSLRFRPK